MFVCQGNHVSHGTLVVVRFLPAFELAVEDLLDIEECLLREEILRLYLRDCFNLRLDDPLVVVFILGREKGAVFEQGLVQFVG